ncbi:MAG: amidohydrolase family protein [Acidobacteria bacterium]|nr:amidohydrolase family protein [Acidobacteriota bacterium]
MSTWKISAVIVLILGVTLIAQQPPGASVTVIRGATVINGTGRPALRNAAILIDGGRIREIGRQGDIKTPARARVLDMRGKWIIPGLIDAHVHFFQSAGIYTRPDVVDLRKWRPYEQELEWIKERLPFTFERYLLSGITGVVDVGGPMWNFEVREIASRTRNAPRVAVAGPLVSTYAPPNLQTGDPAIIRAISPDHARELVRRQLERKPDLIKIWFIHREGDNLDEQVEIVSAAIAESKARGIRVAVHATQLDTAKAAVRAGADILVHSITDRLVDNEFTALAKNRNILYMSTLVVNEGYREVLNQQIQLSDIEQKFGDPEVIASWSQLGKIPPEEIPGGLQRRPNPPARPIAFDNLMLLETAGVRIVGATDAGNIGTLHGPALHREFELMVQAGMRPMDILVSATRNAAAVMGRENDVGTLERGKFADLVILDADPVTNILNTRKIFRVMKAGEFVP